jgi:hypothetical protein
MNHPLQFNFHSLSRQLHIGLLLQSLSLQVPCMGAKCGMPCDQGTHSSTRVPRANMSVTLCCAHTGSRAHTGSL